jgi:hypothetical protein
MRSVCIGLLVFIFGSSISIGANEIPCCKNEQFIKTQFTCCKNEQFIKTQYKIRVPSVPSVPLVPSVPSVPSVPPSIRISSGTNATLTYFDDTQLQCGSYAPGDLVVAVNPKLLGIRDEEWLRFYANASPSEIPWCNKKLTITINFVEYTFTIGDTCDPGKCDYDDVIDIWNGSELLFGLFGDDFYQGPLQWVIQQ